MGIIYTESTGSQLITCSFIARFQLFVVNGVIFDWDEEGHAYFGEGFVGSMKRL